MLIVKLKKRNGMRRFERCQHGKKNINIEYQATRRQKQSPVGDNEQQCLLVHGTILLEFLK